MTIALALASNWWKWLRQLGGPGLVLLGLADNSVVPLPGSMDVLTIWLAVHHPHLAWYYALMATVGAVLGGYITYHVARKGGKAAIDRKLGQRKAKAFYRRFEKWGFWAVTIPALLPPPFPIVPFLLAAGALQYSKRKFLAALALGRAARYGILAALGLVYGRQFLRFFARNTKPTVYVLVAFSLIGIAVAVVGHFRMKKEDRGSPRRTAVARESGAH